MTKKRVRKCSTLLVTEKMQVKNRSEIPLDLPIKMATIGKTGNSKCGRGIWQLELPTLLLGMSNGILRNNFAVFFF